MAPSALPHLLTIGDLARRTGVPPPTLRSWELRHDFPRPVRLAGGHRRYTEPDVGAVLEVLRHRDAGLALDVAVRRVIAGSFQAQARSIYAALRRLHPVLGSQVLSKASLVALSHALEDECAARAQEPLLFGCFQRDRFLRTAQARWLELARTARVAVVFAGPATLASAPSALIEVALPHEAPLNREWAVVCDATDLPACVAAVERPGQEGVPDAQRRFDAIWSVDPRVVRDASRVAVALADEYRPGWRPTDLMVLDEEPPVASSDLHRAADLLNRTMGYLDLAH